MLYTKGNNGRYRVADVVEVRDQFLNMVREHVYTEKRQLTNSLVTRDLMFGLIGAEKSEAFAVVYLTTRHKVIADEILFRGTIDSANVYPRTIVQRCMAHNAAAIVIGHNHPSGDTTPSAADRRITTRIQEACALVDVRVLDHIIVATGESFSFADNGMI